MKKICFFISSINQAGGTGRVCTNIANKLSQLGYKVTILSMYGKTPFFELSPDVSVIAVFSKKYSFKFFLPYVLIRLRKKIITINPDILINVDSALFLYSFVSGLGIRFKNVVWEHFNFNVTLNSKVRIASRRLAALFSDAIVTLTHKDKSNWEKSLDCKAPIYIINNPNSFHTPVINDENRRPIVLSVGRLDPIKGFDRLLDAWQIVINNTKCNWELNIVGSGYIEDELLKQIEQLNLNTSVKLLPETTAIEKHYETASVYCLTSITEGFPMVLLEAQSFGLPIVSYDCETGPSEIINNENGILIKNGDKHALANALIYLMENKSARLTMGEKSFQNSFNYSVDVIIQNWISLFEIHLL